MGAALIPLLIGEAGRIRSTSKENSRIFFIRSASPVSIIRIGKQWRAIRCTLPIFPENAY
jgi:hypothetical protein